MNTVDTIRRAQNLADLYTSTIAEPILESHVERVKTAVINEQVDLAWQFVLDLSEFCDTLEKETNDQI